MIFRPIFVLLNIGHKQLLLYETLLSIPRKFYFLTNNVLKYQIIWFS
ncbi:uncharacterized protein METZ01_LOCUS182112 [marine metagenome]|uniref:Uncharacterized protein n=1 Tax=marine metagenome TaxID=408172 RepID=A0A382CSX9_9ZZZZ